jgi:hypothetical protein
MDIPLREEGGAAGGEYYTPLTLFWKDWQLLLRVRDRLYTRGLGCFAGNYVYHLPIEYEHFRQGGYVAMRRPSELYITLFAWRQNFSSRQLQQ